MAVRRRVYGDFLRPFFEFLSPLDKTVNTVEPCFKAPAYKTMIAYKAFKKYPLIILCSTFIIGSKAF